MNQGNDRSCGAILRQLREDRGWSLRETVRQVGRLYEQEYEEQCSLTLSMVGKWERDEHLPSPIYRKLFCLLYRQTATELGFLPVDTPDKRVNHKETFSRKGGW